MSNIEKFAIYNVHENDAGAKVFREVDGFCTISGKDGALASVKDIRDGVFPAHLASATSIFRLVDQITQESRFVLIERDSKAPFEANKWQFPAGRMGPGELPVDTACRELAEEVCVMVDGQEVPLLREKMLLSRSAGQMVHFENFSGSKSTPVTANSFQEGVTTEFFYDICITVRSLAAVTLKDNEPYGRTLGLFTAEEVSYKQQAGQMTAAAAGIWHRRNVDLEIARDRKSFLMDERSQKLPAHKPGTQ